MPGAVRLGDVCFAGETEIKLLDGTSKRIDELVGFKGFYVYSLDESMSKIVPLVLNLSSIVVCIKTFPIFFYINPKIVWL